MQYISTRYRVIDTLYSGQVTSVFRVFDEKEERKAIIKYIKSEDTPLEDIARLKNELIISQQLKGNSTPHYYELDSNELGHYLVTEDVGGVALRDFSAQHRQHLGLNEAYDIAIGITEALQNTHASGVTHRDVNPNNILVHPDTLQVWLIDFDNSATHDEQLAKDMFTALPQGTLPYVSPEQTGRVNRREDYRTDIYSLGIVLYELFTGTLPFLEQEKIKLIHAHISKPPVPPEERNAFCPKGVSKIILKLLAKNADDRYQQLATVSRDLKACRKLSTEAQEEFVAGKNEKSTVFSLSTKLYGREEELRKLNHALISGINLRFITIQGEFGLGKSSLVQEFYQHTTNSQNLFLQAKFSKYNQQTPYAAFHTIFEQLLTRLKAESSEVISQWKTYLEKQLGENIAFLKLFHEGFEGFWGQELTVLQNLPMQEAANRKQFALDGLLKSLSIFKGTSVIYLDDLQWADSASFYFLQHVAESPEQKQVLFILSFRESHTQPALKLFLQKLVSHKVLKEELWLQPLIVKDITRLLQDSFGEFLNKQEALAELVFQKTNGNPFFVNEFLKILHKNEIISFDDFAEEWKWDYDSVLNTAATGNVLEFMTQQMLQLSKEAQHLLRTAALIGNNFNLKTLLSIQPNENHILAIEEAVKGGFLVITEGNLKVATALENKELAQVDFRFRFIHDRIRESAIQLWTPEAKQKTHLLLGNYFLQKNERESSHEVLFQAVRHLDEVPTSLHPSLSTLWVLNLQASEVAREISAFDTALEFAEKALELFEQMDAPWENYYKLSFDTYLISASLYDGQGQHKKAIALCEDGLMYCREEIHELRLWAIYNQGLLKDGNLNEAVENLTKISGKKADIYGFDFSNLEETNSRLSKELEEQIEKQGFEALKVRPPLKDPETEVYVQLLESVLASAAMSGQTQHLFAFALLIARIAFREGYQPATSVAFSFLGILYGAVKRNFEYSFQFSQLSRWMVENTEAKRYLHRVFTLNGMNSAHLGLPHVEIVKDYERALPIAVSAGDLTYAPILFVNDILTHLFMGVSLRDVKKRSELHRPVIEKSHFELMVNVVSLLDNHIGILEEKNPALDFTQEQSSERDALENFKANSYLTGQGFWIAFRLELLAIMGDFEGLLNVWERLGGYHKGVLGMPLEHRIYFLVLLAKFKTNQAENLTEEESTFLPRLAEYAKACKENYEAFLLLIQAVSCNKDPWQCIQLFERAIEEAHRNGNLVLQGMAQEYLADFYTTQGKAEIAMLYFRAAYLTFNDFGATVKCAKMESRFSELSSKIASSFHTENLSVTRSVALGNTSSYHTGNDLNTTLDLETVVNFSLVISEEVQQNKLLRTLMLYLIENAGAQFGFILLPHQDGNWELVASSDDRLPEDECIFFQDKDKKGDWNLMPESIYNVLNTSEHLLLSNAIDDVTYGRTEYVRKYQAK